MNSVSIEMCSSKTNTITLNASDTDWYITAKTVAKAAELTQYLMKLYNIPLDRVIMHHHVTGKICPNPWCVSEARLSKWTEFKNKLTGVSTATTTAIETKSEEDDEMVETINIKINGKEIKADAIVKDGETFLKLRAFENAGFKVGYNAENKMRTVDNEIKEIPVVVDGKETSVEAVNIADYNYTPIRSLAAALDIKVGYENKKVTLEKCY
jgi:N-acetylmuramoyl-L-alanine amidase CwlA